MKLDVAPAPAAGCDCARCPWFIDNPAAYDPICSGSNHDCAYCGCARAEAAATGSKCRQCPMRCGSRVDIDDWMADVGTLAFDDLTWPPEPHVPELPAYVPQVDTKELSDLNTNLAWPAFAVGLRRVFSPVTWKILPGYRDRTANDALGLNDTTTTVLVGYGEDPLVEAFWTRRHDLIPAIAEQQWGLVLSCNYSMYGNQPRTEHLLNFRRNLQLAVEMRNAGIPAVANLYWFRLEDLKRHLDWIIDEDVDTIAINLQTFRTDDDWNRQALPGLNWLGHNLPDTTRVVLTGSSRIDRIATIGSLFGTRLTLVGGNALLYARHGAVMTTDGRDDIGARTADAFETNVRFYNDQVRLAATGTA